MLKKKIKYTDFDGNELEDDFYFHLSKKDFYDLELDYSDRGGFNGLVQRISEEQDSKKIYDLMQDIVLRSYGEKSENGKSFYKSEQVVNDFHYSDAYDQLILSFFEDPQSFGDFLARVVPADFRQQVEEGIKNDKETQERLAELERLEKKAKELEEGKKNDEE